ncbi:hypothetical protein ACFLR4_01650 [Bacteroidota bacterium]
MKRLLSLILIFGLMIGFAACSSSDDSPTNGGDDTPAWVGTWLSAGTDVAPLLVALFDYDSVRVTMNADNTISLESHIAAGAWSTLPGVYTVTEATTGDIHYININYTAFEQEGIFQVVAGTPDRMQLEVVQTVPDIGAVPRTAASGFGSDAALGTINIQWYNKIAD